MVFGGIGIQENQNASALWLGRTGATEWAEEKGSQLGEFLKARFVDAKNLAVAIGRGARDLWNKAKGTVKSVWGFLTQWAKDDPAGFGAGVAGVALVGALIIAPGATIGAVGGTALAIAGGLWSVAKVASIPLAIGGSFVGGVVGGISAGIALGGRHMLNAGIQLRNFDFSATDAQITASQVKLFKDAIEKTGGLVGQALGSLICGAIAGVATVQVDVRYLSNLFLAINEETQDEILDALTEICHLYWKLAQQLLLLEAYKVGRKWLRQNLPKTGYKRFDDWVASWGQPGAKPWTIAKAIEEAKDNLTPDGKDTQSKFLSNLIEEAFDSCGEALLLIARS